VNEVEAVAVDSSGNAYLTGTTNATNFPTVNAFLGTFTSHQPIGPVDAFVSKINVAGTAFLYSTYLGGSTVSEGFAIAVDTAGHAYVTGATDSADFPTKNSFQPTNRGNASAGNGTSGNVFVTELSADGSALVYSSYLGGTGAKVPGDSASVGDAGTGIAVDAAGNAYVTGVTTSSDFPTTTGAWQPTFGGGVSFTGGNSRFSNVSGDGFVTKVTAGGSSLVYSTYLGGSGPDQALAIAVDGAGDAYITGLSGSFLTPTPFPFALPQDVNTGGKADELGQGFVVKLNAAGSALDDVAYLHARDRLPVGRFDTGINSQGNGVAVDSSGNVYVAGETMAADFPTVNAFQPNYAGGVEDAFLTKINPTLAPDPRNPRFVTRAYLDLLGTAPDASADTEWSLVLDERAGRDDVALAIANSSDYFTRVIDDLYQKYLKRTPDPTGMHDDLLFLTQGAGTVEEIEASIIGSVEYFYVRAGGTDQGFEETLYSDVFGRAIDPMGEMGIEVYLDQQGFTRRQLGEFIFASDEFRFDFINGLYMRFLGRPAEQAGINQWLGYMQAGHRDEEVIAGIVGSPEYFSHV
jgi:hypothetical protein